MASASEPPSASVEPKSAEKLVERGIPELRDAITELCSIKQSQTFAQLAQQLAKIDLAITECERGLIDAHRYAGHETLALLSDMRDRYRDQRRHVVRMIEKATA